MATPNVEPSKLSTVILSAAIGALVGSFGSFAVQAYVLHTQHAEVIRKERADHIEGMFSALSRFGALIASWDTPQADAAKASLARGEYVQPAPYEPLLQAQVLAELYVPETRDDVYHLIQEWLSLARKYVGASPPLDEIRPLHDQIALDTAALQRRLIVLAQANNT